MDELDWARLQLLLIYGGGASRRRIARILARRKSVADLEVLWTTVASDAPRPVRAGCLDLLALIADIEDGRAREAVLDALRIASRGAAQLHPEETETDLILT